MTFTYDIRPHQGAGPIAIGMQMEKVRALFSERPVAYETGSGVLVDAYHGAALQVFYDGDNLVELIQFSRSMAASVSYEADSILSLTAREALERVGAQSANMIEISSGCTYLFPDLDLCFWRPDDRRRRFETVGVGKVGYYARLAR